MRISSFPEVKHADVFLRQLEKTDLGDWFDYLSLPMVTEHTSWTKEAVNNLELSFQACDSTDVNSPIRLAIVGIRSGKLIGTVGFHTISQANRTAEITYDLSPTYWGKGIGTAVCIAMTGWGFSSRDWLRIQATVLETNIGSERVLTKCGFKFEGILRSFRLVGGSPGNFKMFSRISTD